MAKSQEKEKKEKKEPVKRGNPAQAARTAANRIRKSNKDTARQNFHRKNPPNPPRGTARAKRREAWLRVREEIHVTIPVERIDVIESKKQGKLVKMVVEVTQSAWKPSWDQFNKQRRGLHV